ncbi:hypothetical protein [Kistimonas asteriae]|uniref:hypothetical protein n=1 Tax=Kistimonas asteriae TaxID=517724 RepID=UPI001BAD073F|nr:hypothetical protein [Kistimonas asteriae]
MFNTLKNQVVADFNSEMTDTYNGEITNTYKTDDGYTFRKEGDIWTDGDLIFTCDAEGYPLDQCGYRLAGYFTI